jgi:broad specificity phosphatase PhoE
MRPHPSLRSSLSHAAVTQRDSLTRIEPVTTHSRPIDAGAGRSSSARLYVVRHGEVAAHWQDRIYGRLDVPLSERGLAQCDLIAAALAPVALDAVVSSGLQRAEAAAARIRASRPTLVRRDEAAFLELDRGPWAGRSKAELRVSDPEGLARWERSRGVLGPPGSESLDALAARAVPAFAALAAEHPNGAVVVVAHLWITRAAVCAALGLCLERAARIALPPGGFVVLDWPCDGGRPELVALGPALPLPLRAEHVSSSSCASGTATGPSVR